MEINKIYNENCLNTMANMNDDFIDLVITSPPYDDLRLYNGYSFEFEKIATQLFRVVKNGGVCVWIVGDSTKNGTESGTSFKQALFFKQIGFNLHDTMIYKRVSAFPDSVRYYQDFEYMFVFSKGKPKAIHLLRELKSEGTLLRQRNHPGRGAQREKDGTLKKLTQKQMERFIKSNQDDTRVMSNVWNIPAGSINSTKDKIAFNHPAIFPEKLVDNHIKSWSNENDLIYDPFMGSGTTAKMCIVNKRNYIGSEISKEYCDIAENRLKNYFGMFNE